MVFSDPRFFFFLAIVLTMLGIIYNYTFKKRLLVFGSCFFYAAWDWRYLLLLLVIGAIGYISGAIRISGSCSATEKKKWFMFSLSVCLCSLGYFKYSDFFITNANVFLDSLGLSIPRLEILLPIGVSFYTFTTMSYTIDVYRGKLDACKSWLDYATYITFFPVLIAGPIVRGSIFFQQLNRTIGPTRERLVLGISIFLQGFTKKVFIADRLATVADPIFTDPGLYSTQSVWMGLLAYSLLVYCDFSGYSDMAIGLGKMMGFDLPANFKMPYISNNITEFWRRWHLTLSLWFRDYVFLPLAYASSRHLAWLKLSGRTETMVAYAVGTLLTMLLCGLWHGSSWNFVIWGGLHGGALVVHRYWLQSRKKKERLSVWGGWMVTQLFVILAWVPFRAPSLEVTQSIYAKLFAVGGPGTIWIPEWLFWSLPIILLGHLIGISIEKADANGKWSQQILLMLERLGWCIAQCELSGNYARPCRVTVVGSYVIAIWVMIIFYFAPTQSNPFIYFQF